MYYITESQSLLIITNSDGATINSIEKSKINLQTDGQIVIISWDNLFISTIFSNLIINSESPTDSSDAVSKIGVLTSNQVASHGDRPYKILALTLTQSATGAPTINSTMRNEVGLFSLAYVGVGEYSITGSGIFTSGKTSSWSAISVPAGFGIFCYPSDANTISIVTIGDLTDPTTKNNGILAQTYIEIKVFI